MIAPDVTACISTKNRYNIFAHCLQSILLQTLLPKFVLIFDENIDEKGHIKDLRQDPLFAHLFRALLRKGVSFTVERGMGKSQMHNHYRALTMAPTEFLWRIDDDNVLEPDCLEKLMPHFKDPKVGAVGPCVLHTDCIFEPAAVSPHIKDIFMKLAVQFSRFSKPQEVEFLYNTFIFRKSANDNGYNLNLSPVCHREETMFTHSIFKNGYKLIVDGSTAAWHFKCPTGGIRSYHDPSLWDHDEAIFKDYLLKHNIEVNKYKLAYLFNGIGDNFMFKTLLPEFKVKFPDHKLIISTCWPDVFWDEKDCEIVSIPVGQVLCAGNTGQFDIYNFCGSIGFKGHLIDGYRKLYGLDR